MEVTGLVGSVVVEIRADLKPLEKGFDDAKAKSQQFDRQVSGSFTGMIRESEQAGRAVEGSAARAAASNEVLGRSVTVVGSAYRAVTAVAGAAGVALRSIGPAAIAASLGFKAIQDAASEAEHRSVSLGETLTALGQTIGNYLSGTWIGTAFNALVSAASFAFGKLKSAATDLAEWTINAFRAVGSDMAFIWNNLPTIVRAAAIGAANALVSTMEGAINKVRDAVNDLNDAFGGILPKMEHVDLGRFANPAAFDLAAKNAEHLQDVLAILNSTPLRDFGKDVVDQIATNHALESLGDLSKISFGSATGSANGFSSALGGIGKEANGVTVEFGGMSRQVINVGRALQDAKLAQMGDLQQTVTNLHSTQAEIKKIQDLLTAAPHASIADVFGEGFFGNAKAAQDAIERTTTAVEKLFNAYDHGNGSIATINTSIDLLRQSLLQMGGDPVAINGFLDSVVSGEIKVRQLRSSVQGLSDSIRAIPNRTVTITVVTKQVGSGTQSLYDVLNSSGGTSSVGVTRYGGVPGQQSGPSISASSVPRTGYGSMGGSGDSGNTTVNVTRFATGGMIHPGDSQRVEFFKSPEETVGIFTANQMGALANAQSGFTGRDPTREEDRLWTVLMNIEANTRKTFEGVEKWGAASRLSSSGGGSSGISSGGDSSGGNDDPRAAMYLKVLATWRSNFAAAGIVGSGNIGYGSQGLGATPEQIARNIVYGGMSSVGSAGANTYQKTLAETAGVHAYAESERVKAGGLNYGFSTGGMIGPGNGDTQQVEFWKSPEERVLIVKPDQFEDQRGGGSPKAGGGEPPIVNIYQTNNWNGNGPPARESIGEVRRQTSLGAGDALASIYGR